MQKKWPAWLKLFLKITITCLCLWYISTKIDWQKSIEIIQTALWSWILGAVAFFILSKILSAFRLNIYFRNMSLFISESSNIKLYWLGMFYNLFLPGGIGGDAYKVILLKRKYNASTKLLSAAVLLDRVSGIAGLSILAAVYFAITRHFDQIGWIVIALILPGLFLYYVLVKKIFPTFLPGFWPTLWMGLGVQTLQVICVYFILMALNIHTFIPVFIFIFLLSSVVAIFPFTIGGLGAREIVFLWGSNTLLHTQNSPLPVSISLCFYLITVVVSLAGIFWEYHPPFEKG
ncbi:MAG: flippase-like domain-containing protein [Bacteroidetes bacterium]|nr:flippase-like domain-containing protein [Bacteroidota bacterium]